MSETKWQAKNYGDVPQHFELKYSGHRWFLLTDDPWDNGPKDEATGKYAMEHRHVAVASVYSYDSKARKATAELLASAPALAARVEALTAIIEGLECARPVTSNNNLEDSKKNIGVWEYACIDYARLTGHKREWCSVCKAKAALADGGDKS